MEALISVIALILSLAAIWLAIDSSKRIENQSSEIIKVHIASLRNALAESVKSTNKNLVALNQECRDLNELHQGLKVTLSELGNRIGHLEEKEAESGPLTRPSEKKRGLG